MTTPLSTLSPPSTLQLALSALAGQGQHGVVSSLAEEHGVSRQRVYRLRERARTALEGEFLPPEVDKRSGLTLTVTEGDLERAVVALRVATPSSIRDIEDVLPELYGVHWSYGKIQGVLTSAEERAASWLSKVDLAAIDNVALDEMFSQGQPVLGGIDLDFGYLFTLEASPSRSGAEWGAVLGALRQEQTLVPSVVVKDAGKGLASGVDRAWPDAEQRDDLFHAVYDMGKLAGRLEKRAYSTIARVEALLIDREAAATERDRRSLGQQLRLARPKMDEAIERYDGFEALRREAARVLQLTDRGSGRLRTSGELREALTCIATDMRALGGDKVCKLATYLGNRAAGLASYLDALRKCLDGVAGQVGGTAVVEAVTRAWQASLEVEHGGPRWDRKARRDELTAAVRHLLQLVNRDEEHLKQALGCVLPLIAARHRASSPIECLNSVLRPYLVVQKSANQGFLDLFRFYWNTRVRRWGRWKGTSALELLTGQAHLHWLTLLGFPPSERMAAAA